MTQARFELDNYSKRVLDVVKGKYGLSNRNQALKKLIETHGSEYAEPLLKEEIAKQLDAQVAEHKQNTPKRRMSEQALKELLEI